ncbi:MAG: hypothetical protein JOS17DRAFT_795333 [Linnemannia elongata]|nr:MAG: hypothetical protein JOS17DRAFT_795333 [Linnemannia elongata]
MSSFPTLFAASSRTHLLSFEGIPTGLRIRTGITNPLLLHLTSPTAMFGGIMFIANMTTPS